MAERLLEGLVREGRNHCRSQLVTDRFGRDGTAEMWAADAQFLIPAGWTKLAEWTTDEDAAAKRSKPQPVQTVPQLGSMEWFEAQKKKG